MERPDATGLLALLAPPARRARFLEEWRGDLAAARSQGLDRRDLLVGVLRVALLLAGLRVQEAVHRRRGAVELAGLGIGAGVLLAVADVPIEPAVPFALLPVAFVWWRGLLAWIRG